MDSNLQTLREQIEGHHQAWLQPLLKETAKVIIGQRYMMERLLIGLLSRGHVLLEGLPGLAKTLAINTLAKSVQGAFQRVQFTPDLLPSDIVGTMIYNPTANAFHVRKGPIFANFILADEINRAPAKVQSALLEAMQEGQVTIGEQTYVLPQPFLVLATQNPIEQEGTYPLPEAQTDRFMLKAKIAYPSKEDEGRIIDLNMSGQFERVGAVASLSQVSEAQALLRQIYLDERVKAYILNLVFATREPANYGLADLGPMLAYGGSPRASINLALAAKAQAFLERRAHVLPEDVQAIAPDVLRHRLGLSYEAQAEGLSSEAVVERLLRHIPIP